MPKAVTVRRWAGLPVPLFPRAGVTGLGQVSLLLVLHSPVYETNSFASMFVYEKTENPEWLHSPDAFCKQIQILMHTQRLLELHWGRSCREEIASHLPRVSFK